jgi:hypothetical protein
VLALWGCLTGVAISFTGYENLLSKTHPGTWNTLESVTAPISTVMAVLAGHPILAGVQAANQAELSPVSLTSIGRGVESFWLTVGTSARLTIVSPDQRVAAIVATMEPGAELRRGATLSVRIADASRAPREYSIDGGGPLRLPIELKRGLNRLVLTPVATATNTPNPAVASTQQLLVVPSLTIVGSY